MHRSLPLIVFGIVSLVTFQAFAEKLTDEQRIELVRGLTAEYAKAKVELPRSKEALAIDVQGAYDRNIWAEAAHQYGPAARVGDMVQVTKVDIQDDQIVFAINGGFNAGKTKWYQRIQVGMGNTTRPVSQNSNANAPAGTDLVLKFNGPVPALKAEEVKKMLSSILDFEKRSATQTYMESLPPEMQQAVKDKRVVVGMDREAVLLAVGRPTRKVRDIQTGDETEDWIFGNPPGKITFVTFKDNKVIKVREAYAGLGSEAPPLESPR